MILFITGLIIVITAMAQDSRITYNAEVGYLYGLVERMDGYIIRQSDAKINARSLRVYALYSVHSKWQMGLGTGIARYIGTGDNVLEILATVRYKPLENMPNVFVAMTGGKHVGGEDFTSGCVAGVAIGHTWKFSTSIGVYGQVGYDWTHFKRDSWDGYIVSDRHSLSVRFGIMF